MSVMEPSYLATQAGQAYQAGDYQNAARLFGEAASAFTAASQALEAAEMKNNQSVALLQAADARASYQAALGTASVFSSAGDFRRAGMAFGNEASALLALGRSGEACEIFQRAAEAFQQAGEGQMRASVMQAIAGIQLKQGKIMQSLMSMQIGLAGVQNPTFKQKILLFLLRFRAW